MNHPLDKPREESKDDVFDADGNKIVFRDRPGPAAVAAPPGEYDEAGRRVSRMGAGGARSTRGMDPMQLVANHWRKGIADDAKWLQLFSACIQRHVESDIDLEACADEADRAYFQWWQRREAARIGD